MALTIQDMIERIKGNWVAMVMLGLAIVLTGLMVVVLVWDFSKLPWLLVLVAIPVGGIFISQHLEEGMSKRMLALGMVALLCLAGALVAWFYKEKWLVAVNVINVILLAYGAYKIKQR